MSLEASLDKVIDRSKELEALLASPDGFDSDKFQAMSKELSELLPVVSKVEELKRVRQELEDAKLLADEEADPEMKALAEEEVRSQ